MSTTSNSRQKTNPAIPSTKRSGRIAVKKVPEPAADDEAGVRYSIVAPRRKSTRPPKR